MLLSRVSKFHIIYVEQFNPRKQIIRYFHPYYFGDSIPVLVSQAGLGIRSLVFRAKCSLFDKTEGIALWLIFKERITLFAPLLKSDESDSLILFFLKERQSLTDDKYFETCKPRERFFRLDNLSNAGSLERWVTSSVLSVMPFYFIFRHFKICLHIFFYDVNSSWEQNPSGSKLFCRIRILRPCLSCNWKKVLLRKTDITKKNSFCITFIEIFLLKKGKSDMKQWF